MGWQKWQRPWGITLMSVVPIPIPRAKINYQESKEEERDRMESCFKVNWASASLYFYCSLLEFQLMLEKTAWVVQLITLFGFTYFSFILFFICSGKFWVLHEFYISVKLDILIVCWLHEWVHFCFTNILPWSIGLVIATVTLNQLRNW